MDRPSVGAAAGTHEKTTTPKNHDADINNGDDITLEVCRHRMFTLRRDIVVYNLPSFRIPLKSSPLPRRLRRDRKRCSGFGTSQKRPGLSRDGIPYTATVYPGTSSLPGICYIRASYRPVSTGLGSTESCTLPQNREHISPRA